MSEKRKYAEKEDCCFDSQSHGRVLIYGRVACLPLHVLHDIAHLKAVNATEKQALEMKEN